MRVSWRGPTTTLIALLALLVLGDMPVASPALGPPVQLPRLADEEHSELVADGYVLRKPYQSSVVSMWYLYGSRQLWRRDLAVGEVDDIQVIDGVLAVTGIPPSRPANEAQTVAVDLNNGRELWRRPGTLLHHHLGHVAALYCDGCTNDGVGVDIHTGQTVWRSPWLKESNLFDGHAQWSTDDNGITRAIDLGSGAARVIGTLPAGYWILDSTDRYVLALPPRLSQEGPVTYPSVGVFDRQTLHPIATLNVVSHAGFPRDVWLCGELICARHEMALSVFDPHGTFQYSRQGFVTWDVIVSGDGPLLLGTQYPQGELPPGDPYEVTQLVDPATGEVRSDLKRWRGIAVVDGRLWVTKEVPSPIPVIGNPPGPLTTLIGYVDLRPGSPLTVTTLASLHTTFDGCDLDFGWLLCKEVVAGEHPGALQTVAFRLNRLTT
jgi:hypothetical protein